MLASSLTSEKLGSSTAIPENSGEKVFEKGFVPWRRTFSPSRELLTNSTSLTGGVDYLFPPTHSSAVITKLQQNTAETMYSQPSYDHYWPYSGTIRSPETPATWMDMQATANSQSSWLSDMVPPQQALPAYSPYNNGADMDYSHLAGVVNNQSSSVSSLMHQSNYTPSIADSFKPSVAITGVNSTYKIPSTAKPSSITNPPSKSRRYTGRSVCTCPDCQEIDRIGPSAVQLKMKRQHSCHVAGCGKVYSKTSHLKAHLRWHNGSRPFVCNWLFCGKRFGQSDELQRHIRTHTGQKKLICPTCKKRFVKNDHLAKHMDTHKKQNQENPEDGKEENNNNLDSNVTPKQELISQD